MYKILEVLLCFM